MKLQEFFTVNVPLKLLSLLFAAVLWLFVTLEAGDETEIPLAVKFVNSPPGLTLQGGQSTLLSLRIAGPRTLLLRQRWHGATVELELAGARAGRVTFSGLDRHVALLPGVRPLRVAPVSLEIFLTKE
jgi:hypothetical protein